LRLSQQNVLVCTPIETYKYFILFVERVCLFAGPRDCIGQALAKLELQVVLATLLARFRFLPGPKLQQELRVAAATGKPPVAALHAMAGVHITMQPEDGEMMLLVQPRC
jgi:hypothetical protein